ncbi:ABC transporter permease [Nonomuraea sp. NPDC050663]|uniref:ABC transporter permease n=1 Tax=Nonomuraea sp. NPDC050663 TaxID=3364370 RepID=UPI0037A798C7
MTALLFAGSAVFVPGVLATDSLLSMAPFAALLAITAIGQMLVVQQGGLDLSVPGVISMSAVIVTKFPAGDNSRLTAAIALVALLAVAVGVAHGLLITAVGVTPLVATLGVNALLLGGVQYVTNGSPGAVTVGLQQFALAKTLGVPNIVLIAVAVAVVVALLAHRTVLGRRFQAVGSNPVAAHAAAIPLLRFGIGTYVCAAACHATAGVLLSGFIRTPPLNIGDSYLLAGIAAVVVGGTALAGGRGTVLGTLLGALFLTQLNQIVLSLGAGTAVQYLIQGLIIALGVIVYQLRLHLGRLRTAGPGKTDGPSGDAKNHRRAVK